MTEPDSPVPTVAVVDADSVSIGPFTPATLNPEVLAAMGRMTVAFREGLSIALTDLGKRVGDQIQTFRTSLLLEQEPELDMSPRAVALRARQNRHTGPRGKPQHRRR